MLKIDALKVAFGGAKVLNGVSISISKGEFVCLLGSNGAGKTTTLRTISGLITPSSGTIEFLGKRIDGLPPQNIVKMGISHCPEGRQVFPLMSVQENLEMGGWLIPQKVEENLEEVYQLFPILKERKNQLAGSLSGGEQQMLSIGRALMSKPKLLLLDEPSLGLMPILIQKLFKTIKEINEKGMTIFLVEQNARMTLKFADRGYILEKGDIVIEDTAEKLQCSEDVKKAYLGI